jgi:hemoglobin
MKQELKNRNDIEVLVRTFYEKVRKDDVIQHFFASMTDADWQTHLPVMYNFWSSILLGEGTYQGGMMFKHFQLNRQIPMQKPHFDRWEKLFLETVNELFEGELAEEIKRRASSVSQLMHFKIEQTALI